MKNVFLFILFFSISASTYGKTAENLWKDNSGNFLFLYEENNKYIVQRIEIPNDQIQTILETKVFATRSRSLEFLRNQKGTPVSDKLLFTNIQTEIPNNVIWPTLNEWSWEWEKKYADWISENLNASFFVKYKIQTDCADAAVALRWIFARIHFLPAAQTLAVSDRIFSNESMKVEWADLPTHENWNEDQRFLEALDFVLLNTYTHSLYRDSYPIQIDRSTLLMGTHFLKLREGGGHTLILSEYVKNKTLYTLNSDVPRKIRKLERGGFWQSSQPKYGDEIEYNTGGFLRMRWPVKIDSKVLLQAKEDMPYYSLEQYEKGFITNNVRDFSVEVHKRYGAVTTPMDRYNNAFMALNIAYGLRVEIVEEGYLFCSQNDCSEGTQNYENYSTPSRDKKILETIQTIKGLLTEFGTIHPEMVSAWESHQQDVVVTIQDRPLTLSELVYTWENTLYSYDPRVSIAARWGISP